MWHRGIEYDVVRAGGAQPWTWVVRTPELKRGESRSQVSAMLTAKRIINAWCKQNPPLCAPRDGRLLGVPPDMMTG
jgi:hypothetical protein